MKLILLCLLAITLWFPCKGQNNSQAPVSESTSQTESINKNTLSRQIACEAIPLSTMAELMGVEESIVNMEDMSFGKRRSICYYYTKEGNRSFYTRMAWQSEKSEENEVLQKQYDKLLSNGDNVIKEYSEVRGSEGGQILFGIGQDRGNKYVHVLRKRYGNKAEVQFELTKENKDEKTKEILMKILKGID